MKEKITNRNLISKIRQRIADDNTFVFIFEEYQKAGLPGIQYEKHCTAA
jgi:hypothetical protein